MSLVARLFEAPPGTVLVDGHDVRTIPLATLRKAVGYVPQETFLFSATVRENIAFGLPSADGRARGVGGGRRAAGARRGRLPAGLRHLRRRARDHALRRAEAAHGAGPRAGRRPRDPRPRRRALLGGHPHRGGDPPRPARRDGHPHHLPRLPPRLHGEGRRPHRGAEGRAASSSAAPTPSWSAAAASTPTCTAGSSWKRRWSGRRERRLPRRGRAREAVRPAAARPPAPLPAALQGRGGGLLPPHRDHGRRSTSSAPT